MSSGAVEDLGFRGDLGFGIRETLTDSCGFTFSLSQPLSLSLSLYRCVLLSLLLLPAPPKGTAGLGVCFAVGVRFGCTSAPIDSGSSQGFSFGALEYFQGSSFGLQRF